MPGGRGPKSNIGRQGNVVIGSIPLRVLTQTYEVLELPAAVDPHEVLGADSYQAFNRFEATETQAAFDGGYGLNRYSDWRGDPRQAHIMIKEANGVDCRNDTAVLSPLRLDETMVPAASGDIIWFGEIAGSLYCVAEQLGKCVWKRDGAALGSGTWTQQNVVFNANFAPLRQAIGIFNGAFLVGFGALATAKYTTDFAVASDVKDNAGSPNNLYVFAYTSDHASAYIAGGAASTNNNQVMASTDGHTFQTASIVTCGGNDWPIVGLAPGMGVATVMVSKTNELGMIDLGASNVQGASPLYRSLIPFDTRHFSNGLGMHWWMSQGADEQRGYPVFWFPRDRDPWIYTPNNQNAGQGRNIAPWAQPDLHPPTLRGYPQAAIGTGRWLYYSILTAISHVQIVAYDSRTGTTVPFAKDTGNNCRALAISGLYGNNPGLFMAVNNAIGVLILPQDSEYPPDDANCRYTASGTIDVPDMEMGYPLEDKILESVIVAARGLSPLAQKVQVQASLDGAAWFVVGTADTDVVTEILFDPLTNGDLRPTAKRVSLRAILTTTNSALTPQLYALGLRVSINPTVQKAWKFVAPMSPGATLFPGDDLANPHSVIDAIWGVRRHGTPVIYTDLWGDQHVAHVHEIHEMNMSIGINDEPEMVAQVLMTEAPGSVGSTTQLQFTLSGYSDTGLISQLFYPTGLGFTVMSSRILIPATVLSNNHGITVYPIFTVTGPGNSLQLVNSDGDTFNLNYEIKPGEIVTINMDPTKHLVVDQSNVDLSGFVTGTFWGIPTNGTNLTGSMDLASIQPNNMSLIQVSWSPF